MRFKTCPLINIFSDKSSLVLRALLADPLKQWRIPDLAGKGLSPAQVINVIDVLEDNGWLRRHRAWRDYYIQLTHPEELLKEWANVYNFDWNGRAHYQVYRKDLVKDIADCLKSLNVKFALTMISGARLVAPYVDQQIEHIYLDTDKTAGNKVLYELERRLHLPSAKGTGSLCFAVPYYRSSVFSETREVDGLPVVSNLQLYLDLFNHPMTGRDQADWLRDMLKEWGTPLIGTGKQSKKAA